jgi:hypothetical protein
LHFVTPWEGTVPIAVTELLLSARAATRVVGTGNVPATKGAADKIDAGNKNAGT